jgi:general secretion pathway protein A
VYACLLYGILERKGFMVLTGEVGTGKTTLVRRLIDSLEATVQPVFFYNTTVSFDELLTYVCEQLGLEVAGLERLRRIQALNALLTDRLAKKATVVLFIDEAQNLSDDVLENLRLLSNLETPTQKLLQIVLIGQPEFDARLEQTNLRQLRERVVIRSHLHRLGDAEVAAFIDFRLRAVGYQGKGLFTKDAVKRIAVSSRGIPRLVNIICDNALLTAYATSQKAISGGIIGEVTRDLRLNGGAPAASDAAAAKAPAAATKPAREPRAGRRSRWLVPVSVGLALFLLVAGGVAASRTSGVPAGILPPGLWPPGILPPAPAFIRNLFHTDHPTPAGATEMAPASEASTPTGRDRSATDEPQRGVIELPPRTPTAMRPAGSER